MTEFKRFVGEDVELLENEKENEAYAELTGLGTNVRIWIGHELPGTTGEVPRGYLDPPGYRHFIRSEHSAGYLSYGPYQRIEGLGELRVQFLLAAWNKGSSGEHAFTLDIVDHDDGGRTLWSKQLNVGQLDSRSSGALSYMSSGVTIPTNHRLESRVFVGGGCNLRVYWVRWEISLL